LLAIAWGVLGASATAGTAPVVDAPQSRLYEGDVPVRVSMPGVGAVEYVLEIAHYATTGWSDAVREQASSDAEGTLEANLPASWFEQQGPGLARWRLRACLDAGGTQCSEWRMFGRSLGSAPATASETVQPAAGRDLRRAATAAQGGSHTPGPAVIASPTPGNYAEDVPILIQSPAGSVASAFVMQLAFYDRASDSWIDAHEEQVEADGAGAVSSALSLDALAGLQPDVVRWRIRARPADQVDAWSTWVVFGIHRDP
jgi:hypothetical protein